MYLYFNPTWICRKLHPVFVCSVYKLILQCALLQRTNKSKKEGLGCVYMDVYYWQRRPCVVSGVSVLWRLFQITVGTYDVTLHCAFRNIPQDGATNMTRVSCDPLLEKSETNRKVWCGAGCQRNLPWSCCPSKHSCARMCPTVSVWWTGDVPGFGTSCCWCKCSWILFIVSVLVTQTVTAVWYHGSCHISL